MPAKHRFRVRVGEDDVDVEVSIDDDGSATAVVGNQRFEVRRSGDGSEVVRVRGETVQTRVSVDDHPLPRGVSVDGIAHEVEVRTAQAAAAEAALAAARGGGGGGLVSAPMPGRVVRVLVAEGDAVEAGAPVVIVEAMKMENELTAPTTGTVSRIHVAAGDTVDSGATLCEIAAHDDSQ